MDQKPLKIYCDSNSKNVLKIIQHMNVERVEHPDDGDILWFRSRYNNIFKTLNPNQYINHFHTEGCMVDKGKLYASLQCYMNAQTDDTLAAEAFLQPSYRLNNETERAAFLAQLPAQDTVENLWILKPANLSKGIGVQIVWQFDQLKQVLVENKGVLRVKNHGLQEYTIQKYIQNPLLLEGRKSEIRVYWLIACVDPLMVLMFNEGTVRLNTLPFKLDDFDNQLIHVTNVHQQKKHPEYDPEAILKWNFADLQTYLIEKEYTDQQNYLSEVFMPRCHDIIRTVVAANINKLRENNFKGQYFGLYGADIILDSNLTPWLAEIQKGPGLSHSDDIKKRVIPPMLHETFTIMAEIRQRKLNQKSLQQIEAVKNFEWVINEAK